MVDFAGWEMPVQYSSIVAEHNATRGAVGLFDVSHMGRILLARPESDELLDRVVTRRVRGMKPGQIRYALVTNDQGGILDDVLVYRVPEANGGSYFQLVVNASNRQKIVQWLAGRIGDTFVDVTTSTAMIAVQGPRALAIVRPFSSVDPSTLRYYHGCEAQLAGKPGILSRTGYTGEDGCELIVPAEDAMLLWETLAAAAAPLGGMAAGLGARDTLRLEAGMPLYGHELNEHINPLQAGLGYAVDLDGRQFPGRDALAAAKQAPIAPVRAGWKLASKRVPREGFDIYQGDALVGSVTSGTFSPTLEAPIAMGYVKPEAAKIGQEVTIDIRGKRETARTVALPFYRRAT